MKAILVLALLGCLVAVQAGAVFSSRHESTALEPRGKLECTILGAKRGQEFARYNFWLNNPNAIIRALEKLITVPLEALFGLLGAVVGLLSDVGLYKCVFQQ